MAKSQSLLKERKELFHNAIQMKKNKRTPLFCNYSTWKIFDAGYKLSEAINNYDIMEKVQCEFHERYQFDSYIDLGARNPIRITDSLGAGYHKINDENESIIVIDHKLMERNEYKEIIENPLKFYWEKAFARYTPHLTIQQLQNAMQEFLAFGQFVSKMNNKFFKEYQCPLISPTIFFPFEYFFLSLRGIKEVSIDMRKCKQELNDAMEMLYAKYTVPPVQKALKSNTSSFVCDSFTGFLGHSILSEKQFGEFYWPYFKRVLDKLSEKNKTMFIFCESTMLRFSDFFNDIPKGRLMIHLEQDNIFEIHKKLPNICFVGGMPVDLLGNGTPQQCIDYAKKLIDELGDGYILSANKLASFRYDSKRENILAINELVQNYKH